MNSNEKKSTSPAGWSQQLLDVPDFERIFSFVPKANALLWGGCWRVCIYRRVRRCLPQKRWGCSGGSPLGTLRYRRVLHHSYGVIPLQLTFSLPTASPRTQKAVPLSCCSVLYYLVDYTGRISIGFHRAPSVFDSFLTSLFLSCLCLPWTFLFQPCCLVFFFLKWGWVGGWAGTGILISFCFRKTKQKNKTFMSQFLQCSYYSYQIFAILITH